VFIDDGRTTDNGHSSILKAHLSRKMAPRPGSHVFKNIIMILAILIYGHLKTVSTKYQSTPANGFGEEDFQSFYIAV